MRKAVAILLLIPFALVGTLVGGFISGVLLVIAENPGSWTNPAGVLAAGAFVGMQGAVPATVFTVPASLLAFPLAYYVLPPRGHSALHWTLHCAGLGVGLAVLGAAGIFAVGYLLAGSNRTWDQLNIETSLLSFAFLLFAGAITGALFGLAKHKITARKDRPLTGTKVDLYWLGLVLPLGLLVGAFVYGLGLHLLGWRPPARLVELWFARGVWAGAAFVAGSALVLALVRRRALEGTEVALYWLGTAFALTVALPFLFEATGWSFIGKRPGAYVTGSNASSLLAGAGLAAGSALVLALVQGRALSAAGLLIYGSGSAVAIGFTAGTLWSETLSAGIAGAVLAGLIGLILLGILTNRMKL